MFDFDFSSQVKANPHHQTHNIKNNISTPINNNTNKANQDIYDFFK